MAIRNETYSFTVDTYDEATEASIGKPPLEGFVFLRAEPICSYSAYRVSFIRKEALQKLAEGLPTVAAH